MLNKDIINNRGDYQFVSSPILTLEIKEKNKKLFTKYY